MQETVSVYLSLMGKKGHMKAKQRVQYSTQFTITSVGLHINHRQERITSAVLVKITRRAVSTSEVIGNLNRNLK